MHAFDRAAALLTTDILQREAAGRGDTAEAERLADVLYDFIDEAAREQPAKMITVLTRTACIAIEMVGSLRHVPASEVWNEFLTGAFADEDETPHSDEAPHSTQ